VAEIAMTTGTTIARVLEEDATEIANILKAAVEMRGEEDHRTTGTTIDVEDHPLTSGTMTGGELVAVLVLVVAVAETKVGGTIIIITTTGAGVVGVAENEIAASHS